MRRRLSRRHWHFLAWIQCRDHLETAALPRVSAFCLLGTRRKPMELQAPVAAMASAARLTWKIRL